MGCTPRFQSNAAQVCHAYRQRCTGCTCRGVDKQHPPGVPSALSSTAAAPSGWPAAWALHCSLAGSVSAMLSSLICIWKGSVLTACTVFCKGLPWQHADMALGLTSWKLILAAGVAHPGAPHRRSRLPINDREQQQRFGLCGQPSQLYIRSREACEAWGGSGSVGAAVEAWHAKSCWVVRPNCLLSFRSSWNSSHRGTWPLPSGQRATDATACTQAHMHRQPTCAAQVG